ncbi:MAG: hypothetical protein IPP08_09810 [Chlorobiota bacterium]|jgi:hypothetical protein|nr:hypothetical protein [Chlorobiota bacterium]QQS66057.1 MAG: hypothetical protein IPP08_09810 [Chlorobiota bacterium]
MDHLTQEQIQLWIDLESPNSKEVAMHIHICKKCAKEVEFNVLIEKFASSTNENNITTLNFTNQLVSKVYPLNLNYLKEQTFLEKYSLLILTSLSVLIGSLVYINKPVFASKYLPNLNLKSFFELSISKLINLFGVNISSILHLTYDPFFKLLIVSTLIISFLFFIDKIIKNVVSKNH